MTKDEFGVYTKTGGFIGGSISNYKDLAVEINDNLVTLYFSHNKDSIIIGSLIGIKDSDKKEEKSIIIQEFSKDQFLANINIGFVNYFKKIGEVIEVVYKSKYSIESIGDEYIDYDCFIEDLYNYALSKDNFKKTDLSRLIGKFLSIDPECDKKITIKTSKILTSIYFIITISNSFPHLLYNYSIVIAKNNFKRPVDLILLKSTETYDFDIDSNTLLQSEIERSIYYSIYVLYHTRLKNKRHLTPILLNEQITKLFHLGGIGNKQNWSNINRIPKLKNLVKNAIISQFDPALMYQFLFGYKGLNKTNRADMLKNIKSDPFDGKNFYKELLEIMKSDPDLVQFFDKKYKKQFFDEGYKKGMKQIPWIKVIILITLLIMAIIFLISLHIMPDFYTSLLNQLSSIPLRRP